MHKSPLLSCSLVGSRKTGSFLLLTPALQETPPFAHSIWSSDMSAFKLFDRNTSGVRLFWVSLSCIVFLEDSSLLPRRLGKLNWCLAAGQDLFLEILFSKDFVWCCQDAFGSVLCLIWDIRTVEDRAGIARPAHRWRGLHPECSKLALMSQVFIYINLLRDTDSSASHH